MNDERELCLLDEMARVVVLAVAVFDRQKQKSRKEK